MAFGLDVYTSIPSNYFGVGGQCSRLAVFILPVALELLVRLTGDFYCVSIKRLSWSGEREAAVIRAAF